MVANNLVLVPGAGGVGRTVFEHLRAQDVPVRFMVRRDDERASELRALGAEVVIGDLTRPETVAAALQGVARMYFGMRVSPDHLLAATVVASVAKEYGKLEALVDLSQMTVSQMTATSTEESHQQRMHWLAEQVFDWSGLPVVHIRPTAFLDTPLFTTMAARSIQENGTIAVPFGTGRTSPVAVDDVARVIATVLRDPAPHIGQVYELTGPRLLTFAQAAGEISKATGREIQYVPVSIDDFAAAAYQDLPGEFIELLTYLFGEVLDGRNARLADGVQRALGREPRDFRDYARDAAATGVWNAEATQAA
jgi:uncharacterized protein YbjT (DUF2867 family)